MAEQLDSFFRDARHWKPFRDPNTFDGRMDFL
jgi:hypothetical protein